MMKRNMEHERIIMGGLKAKLDAITQELKRAILSMLKFLLICFFQR